MKIQYSTFSLFTIDKLKIKEIKEKKRTRILPLMRLLP